MGAKGPPAPTGLGRDLRSLRTLGHFLCKQKVTKKLLKGLGPLKDPLGMTVKGRWMVELVDRESIHRYCLLVFP